MVILEGTYESSHPKNHAPGPTTMPLTPEQRSEINRQNAAHSTGPKTEEGKHKSRRNAMKHGLRSEVLAVENEDPQVVAEREEAWFAFYRPESPAAQHLATCCVRASLLADRVDRVQTALINRQLRDAQKAVIEADQDELSRLLDLLVDDPGEAARLLRRTGCGCRHLIRRWERLRGKLEAGEVWTGADQTEAMRLQGYDPDRGRLAQNEGSFFIRMCATILNPLFSVDYLKESVFAPANVPEGLRRTYAMENRPTPEQARAMLLELTDGVLADLRDQEQTLREAHEQPSFAEAGDRASVVVDPTEGRLLLRYLAESRTAFQRAHRELERTLKDDAERRAAQPAAPSPNEPKSPEKPAETAPKPAEPAARSPRPVRSAGSDAPEIPPRPVDDLLAPRDFATVPIAMVPIGPRRAV